MKKKEIIICIIILLLSIASISTAVIVRDSKKVVTHIKETSTDIKNIEEEKEKNNTEKLNHPIDYDDLERKLLNLVNNEGYSIIKRNCEEKVGKEKKDYIKTDNTHISTKSISDLLIKLREATSVIEQEESNVCPSISYYVASDTKEVLQVFYSVDQISFVVKVNNVAYNFKYDDAKSIKDFIENLK